MNEVISTIESALQTFPVTPSQIPAHVRDVLAARGIRQPGGLYGSTVERATLDALQIIFDQTFLVVDAHCKNKGAASHDLSSSIIPFLQKRFSALTQFAEHEIPHSASLAKAKADQLSDLACKRLAAA